MNRWSRVCAGAVVVLLSIGVNGCGGGSDGADDAAMTKADRIVCKRAAEAGTSIGGMAVVLRLDEEWARIERNAKDAHPEFRAAVAKVKKPFDEQWAFATEYGFTNDEIDTGTPYQDLLSLCADNNYDLDE